MYGLLTKCEVMAKFIIALLAKKNEANIQPSWPNKLDQ